MARNFSDRLQDVIRLSREEALRLGHDYNTYIKHYGSADIFNNKDMREIRELLGSLYLRQRRY